MYINPLECLKEYYRRAGYEIVDDNKQYDKARPFLIVWHRNSDTMVYIDFRIYNSPRTHMPRLWYKNWLHRALVRNQFRFWMRINKWRSKHRFDVVMIFPPCGCIGRPVVEHIMDVKM